MKFRSFCLLTLTGVCAVPWLILTGSLQAQQSVLSYHNDIRSTGQNLNESALLPSTVNPSKFGKIYSAAVDGQIYAQPLYVPALPITGGSSAGTTHDTVFVATQHDSVYALDAISGATLWQVNLVDAAGGETSVPKADSGTSDINFEIGITSTPTIEATAEANGKRYMYVVAKSKLVVSGLNHYYFRLHVIDIASGAERGGSPVVIAETSRNSGGVYTYYSGPSVAGTGAGAINNVVGFNALRENQRPGLTLANNHLYIAFASHGDNGPYHGWVLSYDPKTLVLNGTFNDSPNGSDGGIWMSGDIVTVDDAGALYFASGNGSFANNDPNTDPVAADFDAKGFPLNFNYGDSIVKLVADSTTTATNPGPNGWGLKVADYFTAYNQRNLNNGDTDVGSGGTMLLPDSMGSAAHPHLLIESGKEGRVYLLDRDNMGKFRGGITGTGASADFVTTGDQLVQEAPGAIIGSLDTPAYFNGTFYFAGAYSSDVGKSFSIANGVMSAKAVTKTPDSYGYLGATPSISASNATSNGIVWMVDRGTNQLRAYSADNLATELYTSGQAANSRDILGTASKFLAPTVADGHVFVGTSEPDGPSALVVYGLFAPTTTPPAQPLNLYAQTVSGGEIDLFWSDVADNESGYEIYVSTDPDNFPTTPRVTTGADSTSASIRGLQVSTTYYFRVRAVNSVGASAYTNIAATTSGTPPPVDFSNGFAGSDDLLTANGFSSNSAIVGTVLRITDSDADEAHSVWLNTAQDVAKFSTEFTFTSMSASGDGFMFVIQKQGLSALGAYGGDLGYKNITPSAGIKFDLYPNSSTTGLYVGGVAPSDAATATAPSSGSIDATPSGINFHSGDTFRVVLTYDGTTLVETITDTITRATFSHSYTVDLKSVLGGSTAGSFIGFTGGTGAATAIDDISTWSFSPTLPVAPAAPTNLVASAASATQVNLNWNDNSNNENSFRIERAPGTGGTFAAIGSVGSNTTMYVDSNLISNATYSYRIVASASGLDSAASNVVSITTPVPPTRPSGATPTLVAPYEIDFKWNDNSDNETGFKILRGAGESSNFETIAILPANTTSYKDTGVVPDTDYDYHIEAINEAGYVDFTGFGATTPSAVNIVTSNATAQEATGQVGTFAVRRSSALSTPLTVNYTILKGAGQADHSTRYKIIPTPSGAATGSVTIPANSSAATITVQPLSDMTVVGPQSVTLKLASGTGYGIVGNSVATVTLLDTPLNTWKVQEFGSITAASSPKAADTADFDGDGTTNIVEYALGNDPTKAGDTNRPKPAVETISGSQYLTLTFKRPHPVVTDITYIVEGTTSLTSPTWQPAVLVSGYPVDNGDGTETVKYRAPSKVSAAPQQDFIRLRVTHP